MKAERVAEYARMVLGPVRFADKETRAQTIHTLHRMLDEEFGLIKKAARHPKPVDETSDAYRIGQSQHFSAVTLAKAGVLAPWKEKLAKVLGL